MTTKKTTKASQLRATLFQKASSLKATSLANRQETVFRKARELSILCGVEVCVIYYGSDGELRTWPKDREKVKDLALRYSRLSDVKRHTKQHDLDTFLEEIDDPKNKKKVKLDSGYKYPDWDPRFDNFSAEQLTELIQSLERKQAVMQHRLRAVLESQRQRSMRYMNQEQMQMNHLQLPNQAQSLAPLPNSLTVYQYPNMETYPRLLGAQDTGMNGSLGTNMLPYNGSLGTNMLPYNSFNTNCVDMFPNQFNQNCSKVEVFPQGTGISSMKVEDYTGPVWAQGSEINGLQNMDMYRYNNNNNSNTNGFSHQLVQFPAQRAAAPVYQCMDGSTQNNVPTQMRFNLSQCL
ncbi:AGAMOUS-like 103 [Raphanus sativus]|nr:AGAMOUS-like 103 [Raphanus sativus]